MVMAAPASAASPICEASGGHWCLGSADSSNGTHITLRMPGRVMHFHQTQTCDDGHGVARPCGQLIIDATGQCLAEVLGGIAVAQGSCGATGTAWMTQPSNGHTIYINKVVTNSHSNGKNFELTADDGMGDPVAVFQEACGNSCFQRFDGG
jgi:hypothetical protein